MRVIVCVTPAASVEDEVEFTPDGRAVDPLCVDVALNEWDAYATETAVRLREASVDTDAGEVVTVTVGDREADPVIRRCLAMGADRAIRAWNDGLGEAAADPLGVAAVLAGAIRDEQPDLVLCGYQSADGIGAATGTALAALLGLPVATCVVGLEIDATKRSATVRRELEGGIVETRMVALPAVLTIQSGINEPRYATFRAIKQAEQKELRVVDPDAPPPVGAFVGRMSIPVHDRHAEMIPGKPAQVAARIAEIVKERVG
jgi:electron transfer flavoprotein beta subunit